MEGDSTAVGSSLIANDGSAAEIGLSGTAMVGEIDELAARLRTWLGSPRRAEFFQALAKRGLYVVPAHYYSPVPDIQSFEDDLWARRSELIGLSLNEAVQLHLLRNVFPRFRSEYSALPSRPTGVEPDFYLGNGMFDGTDALVMYCMLRHWRPQHVLEVGAGWSSRIIARALVANGAGDLICIEPHPDEGLVRGFSGLKELISQRVEETDLRLFERLRSGDILSIDSSHVVRIGGDVTWLYLEVLPRLRPGVLVHIHDIFLPREYPREWVLGELRFWSEQYLLHAFLLFNTTFDVVFANNYMALNHSDDLKAAFPEAPWWGGGSFWIRRRPEGVEREGFSAGHRPESRGSHVSTGTVV